MEAMGLLESQSGFWKTSLSPTSPVPSAACPGEDALDVKGRFRQKRRLSTFRYHTHLETS
jgi:hypothetical protein